MLLAKQVITCDLIGHATALKSHSYSSGTLSVRSWPVLPALSPGSLKPSFQTVEIAQPVLLITCQELVPFPSLTCVLLRPACIQKPSQQRSRSLAPLQALRSRHGFCFTGSHSSLESHHSRTRRGFFPPGTLLSLRLMYLILKELSPNDVV